MPCAAHRHGLRPALAVALFGAVANARDLASCTRQRVCNGEYLCADVCKLGTVVPDPHTQRALKLQNALQFDERIARHTFPGSHNSAISLGYGFGIEMDGIEKLLNTTLYKTDDLGEGVCQSFTLTDQLNFGLRHLEIDITAAYFEFPPKLNDVFVCHSPVPLDPMTVLKVEAAALRHKVKLGDWKPGVAFVPLLAFRPAPRQYRLCTGSLGPGMTERFTIGEETYK
eukprot:TRINITY_DN14993_c0_g1_i3.p1 TRINITY_DN14993_c0_g1~~TRINITY_DN14993_c0_g1_i3.p1  ORF type:complete len:227 (+),score=29.27 TRINITY_DN14993_c0_g1_i3:67-747(+)